MPCFLAILQASMVSCGVSFREGGENSAGVEPAGAERAEDVFEVEVIDRELGGGGVAAVGGAFGGPEAEATFGEVEPLRAATPRPSKSAHLMNWVSTPPCRTRSSRRRPTSLSTNAVRTAARLPKQRRRPRATLYSPPPSQAWNGRVVRTRPSPGSRRSMISPIETMS